MAGFTLPPAPTLPKNAPWTDAQLIENYLYGILQAMQSLATGIPITLPAPVTPPSTGPVIPSGGATLDDVLTVLNRILVIQTNVNNIQTLVVPVTTPNQQIQFTTLTVPDGFPLLVESHPNNNSSGLILVMPKNGSIIYNVVALKPGQFVSYRVKTSDALYIAGTIPGDKIILTSELR
jgi:hypothetical protein